MIKKLAFFVQDCQLLKYVFIDFKYYRSSFPTAFHQTFFILLALLFLQDMGQEQTKAIASPNDLTHTLNAVSDALQAEMIHRTQHPIAVSALQEYLASFLTHYTIEIKKVIAQFQLCYPPDSEHWKYLDQLQNGKTISDSSFPNWDLGREIYLALELRHPANSVFFYPVESRLFLPKQGWIVPTNSRLLVENSRYAVIEYSLILASDTDARSQTRQVPIWHKPGIEDLIHEMTPHVPKVQGMKEFVEFLQDFKNSAFNFHELPETSPPHRLILVEAQSGDKIVRVFP